MNDSLELAGTFGTIVVDPPWAFTFSTRKSEAGNNGWRGGTDRHYRNMSIAELRELPVPRIAAQDSCLWLWSVNALLDDAVGLMRDWGFEYKNMLTWAKTNKARSGPSFGMGYWLRGATEHLLLGVKGSPKPLRRNQVTWFSAPPLRHSEKPQEAYDIIRSLTPGPYIDVFARQARPGWSSWGDEAPANLTCSVDSTQTDTSPCVREAYPSQPTDLWCEHHESPGSCPVYGCAHHSSEPESE